MRGCPTRWWRCATAPWAGASPALPATAARPRAPPTSRAAVSPGPKPPPSAWRAASASRASISQRSSAGAPTRELRIDCAGLDELMARNEATIVDLSISREYLKAHIPGAWFALRSRLKRALAKMPLRGTLVLTSEDGVLAGRAVPEARALTG